MSVFYQLTEMEIWHGRSSNDASYLHETIQPLDLSGEVRHPNLKGDPVILGYACDAGVSRNLGRPGAAKGPETLRKALGKMPRPQNGPIKVWDAGNIFCHSDQLEDAQQLFAEKINAILELGGFPIAIGGGHDIAFGHYTGIRTYCGTAQSIGIINFDAHLDLRKPDPAPHSGSPFYQIAESCRTTGIPFQYACIGLREDANPNELWERADSLSVLQILRSELVSEKANPAMQKLKEFISNVDRIYLTIDLDGFSSAVAPGVSAASPMGFFPQDMLPFLLTILSHKKLISVDFAELNPEFDRDNQTAILVASLIHTVLAQK
jgi:formiminoglutamase